MSTQQNTMTYEIMNEYVEYKNGKLYWRKSCPFKQYVGLEVGHLKSGTYRRFKLMGIGYYSHRVVWLLHHRQWPNDQIDHINCIKTDNRIENLRECDNRQNHFNIVNQINNTSGQKGVAWSDRDKRWRAYITVNGICKSLGYFVEKEDATNAYQKEAKKLHGEFYCKVIE